MTSYRHGDHVESTAGIRRLGRADGRTVAHFRDELSTWITDGFRLSDERRADILLAVDEALSNCADHAYEGRAESGPMRLTAEYDGGQDTLRFEVSDEGVWREPATTGATALRGRGLILMRSLADGVQIDRRADGTTVSIHFHDCPSETPLGETRELALSGSGPA